MANIVLATFGSLGDLHPKIALGLELKARGHDVTVAAMEYYREKIELLRLGFRPMAPHLALDDLETARDLLDVDTGTENIIRGLVMPNLRPMYDELTAAVENADLLVTGEIVYAARSVVEKTGIKWASTSVAPISFFSAYDPPVPPQAQWVEGLRFLGSGFHRAMFGFARGTISSWYEPYRKFRSDLGLDPDHDPIFNGKFSDDLHLAMFSRVLAAPQPDWPPATVQTGFCFYDGQSEPSAMPEELDEFLNAGEPPIVFTLGSAASLDPGNFFEESLKAAHILGRRAVLVYGIFTGPPGGLGPGVAAFDYAPYSLVFPRAAAVVHQGGVGTTGQALRAGVPQLIMPYANDQPDNAARCRRAGVAEVIARDRYSAERAASALQKLLGTDNYRQKASEAAAVVAREGGTAAACDAIEAVLRPAA